LPLLTFFTFKPNQHVHRKMQGIGLMYDMWQVAKFFGPYIPNIEFAIAMGDMNRPDSSVIDPGTRRRRSVVPPVARHTVCEGFMEIAAPAWAWW
jgi:hypothetical protein